MKRFPLSKTAFGQFLKEHPRMEFTRASPTNCPIARALKEIVPKAKQKNDAFGAQFVSVNRLVTQIGAAYYNTPDWARAFIGAYDHSSLLKTARQVWRELGNR